MDAVFCFIFVAMFPKKLYAIATKQGVFQDKYKMGNWNRQLFFHDSCRYLVHFKVLGNLF